MGLFSSDILSQMSGGIMPAAPVGYVLPTQFPPISKAKRIILDVESYDPDLRKKGPGWRRDAYIVGGGVQAIWKDDTIFKEYYPLRHRTGPNIDESKFWEWLGDELPFYSGELVGANLPYDIDGVSYKGVIAPFAVLRDVQWAEALLDEKAEGYRLELLAQKYLNEHKVTNELKELYNDEYIKRFREIHPGHARNYVLGDIDLPNRILDLQYKQLKKEHLLDLFDLESRLLPLLIHMRQVGQRVDNQHAHKLGEMFIGNRDEALKRSSDICGIKLTTENFQSPRTIGRALDNLKIKYPLTPKSKLPSIQDEWLKKNAGEFGLQLALANTNEKAYKTFVTGYVTDYQIDGRVHCEFHPLRKSDDSGKKSGTVTGRFSSSHPNLQNIPKRDPIIGPLCRAMFIPEKGYLQYASDYSQIEFRLLVHAAVLHAQTDKATAKKRWGKYGEDIWDRLQSAFKAQQMYINDPKTDFHDAVVTLTGLLRDPAKTINFGIAFNMGVDSMAVKLGLADSEGKATEDAVKIMKKYHDNVPFVKAIGQAMAAEAEREGITSTLLGRRTHFNLYEPKFREDKNKYYPPLPLEEAKKAYGDKLRRADTQKSLNCYTQGGGADLIKTSMVRIWESGLLSGEELILSLTVHDELGGSVLPTKIGMEKLRELQNMMENAIPLSLPVLTACKTGANWSEAH
jgi:DNA polymerase I-like protein with 3'-5' exonuclease and polymerase domains